MAGPGMSGSELLLRFDSPPASQRALHASAGLKLIAFKLITNSKTVAVFRRSDKRFDHLCLDKITIKLIELRKPELETVRIRIAP